MNGDVSKCGVQCKVEMKEDAEFVSEAILQALQDATEQAKKKNDDAMSGLTGGMQMPGLF